MVAHRVRRLMIIFSVVVSVFIVILALPAFAQELTLVNLSGKGNHYETVSVISLTAGQEIDVRATCGVDEDYNAPITYVHYLEVGAVPTPEHPEYNDSIYYWRGDCFDVSRTFVAPVSADYRFIFHVHTTEYGCDEGESCPNLTGISHFKYDLRVTTGKNDTPTDVPTDVPTDTPTDVPTDVPTDTPTDVPTDVPTDLPTDVPTDTPTDTPTDVPTDTPTDVPTDTPTDVPTDTPTEVPTDTPTEVPTDTPTDVPTDVPTREAPVAVATEPAVVVSLPIPPDARFNWHMGDLTAVIYRNRDEQANAALVVYAVNEASRGYFLCTVTQADIAGWTNEVLDENTLVKSCSDAVKVYVLTSGEIQINIVEGGKTYAIVFDSLSANNVQRYLIEA